MIETLLLELSSPSTTPTVFCDNQGVVALAHNPILYARTKHMELDLFFVHKKVLAKQLCVSHVPAQDQWVDLFTEALAPTGFLFLWDKSSMYVTCHQNLTHLEFVGGGGVMENCYIPVNSVNHC